MSEAIASKEARLAAYNANIAAADKDPQLSPETGKPLSKVNTIRFGAGFLLFGVLWMSGLGIVSAVLLPMHYKTIEGADPDALVGIVNAFTAVASLVANLMFGNFSDRSRSRFGRRTPWIVFGAVLGGVTLFLTGTTHNAVLLTIFYCACMFGLNCMIAPLVAVLSDRVPSGIRGTMSAFYGAGSTIGAPIGTMIGAFFIENLTVGFAVAGVLMFLGGVVAVIILPKEQSADFLPKEEGSFKDVLVSFRPPKFAGAHDFYKAFAGRFCMIMSYQMINVYQLYIIQNYIGQSVKESAVTVSVVSMIMMVMSLVGSFISGPVSDLIGRRKVPVVVASVLFANRHRHAVADPVHPGHVPVRRHRWPRLCRLLRSRSGSARRRAAEQGRSWQGSGHSEHGHHPWPDVRPGHHVHHRGVPRLQLRLPGRHRPGHHRLLLHHGHQEGQVTTPPSPPSLPSISREERERGGGKFFQN